MSVRSFRKLGEPIERDRERMARVRREQAKVVAEVLEFRLGELRKHRGVTQAQLAELLGVAQPNVSRLERATDPHLSTLVDFIEALGGRLELAAVFDDERIEIHV